MNYYELRAFEGMSIFRSYTLSSSNKHKKLQFTCVNTLSESTIKDSSNYVSALVNHIEIEREFGKELKISLSGKHALALDDNQSELGYGMMINFRANQIVMFELKIEKLVLGDYVNSFKYSAPERFPYFGYLKCSINL